MAWAGCEREFRGLEQTYAANSHRMPWIGRDHMFDPLRSEPRFAALLKQVHLAR